MSLHSNAAPGACQEPLPATVVLVRPREEGNVGAVARAMANMGLADLVLVEPAPAIGGVARGFGVGGWDVLDGARRAASLADAVAPFRRVVGTSAGRERGRAVRAWRTPRELAAQPWVDPTALVFGPEDSGLRRDELELCQVVVQVPCAPRRPTLNLAQAVLIVTYELFLAGRAGEPDAAEKPPATAGETAGVLAAAAPLLRRLGFDHEPIHAALMRDAGRLLRRSGATSHEVRVLWRVLNRAARRLDGDEDQPPA